MSQPLPAYQENSIRKFLSWLPQGARRILEIGSDLDCAVMQELARQTGAPTYGVNSNRSFAQNVGPLDFVVPVCSSGDLLPFPDNSFDAVFSVATLEHVSNVELFLKEVSRVLCAGGVFFTFFGPIFSCAVGHHVNARVGGKAAKFWQPGKNPIPDFYHLLLDEHEMRELLLSGSCDDRLVDPIIHWIYHGDGINRLHYEEYVRHFEQSPLGLLHLEGRPRPMNLPPSGTIRDQLYSKYGPSADFLTATIEAALAVPANIPGKEFLSDEDFLFVCPQTQQPLVFDSVEQCYAGLDWRYPVINHVPILLKEEASPVQSENVSKERARHSVRCSDDAAASLISDNFFTFLNKRSSGYWHTSRADAHCVKTKQGVMGNLVEFRKIHDNVCMAQAFVPLCKNNVSTGQNVVFKVYFERTSTTGDAQIRLNQRDKNGTIINTQRATTRGRTSGWIECQATVVQGADALNPSLDILTEGASFGFAEADVRVARQGD